MTVRTLTNIGLHTIDAPMKYNQQAPQTTEGARVSYFSIQSLFKLVPFILYLAIFLDPFNSSIIDDFNTRWMSSSPPPANQPSAPEPPELATGLLHGLHAVGLKQLLDIIILSIIYFNVLIFPIVDTPCDSGEPSLWIGFFRKVVMRFVSSMIWGAISQSLDIEQREHRFTKPWICFSVIDMSVELNWRGYTTPETLESFYIESISTIWCSFIGEINKRFIPGNWSIQESPVKIQGPDDKICTSIWKCNIMIGFRSSMMSFRLFVTFNPSRVLPTLDLQIGPESSTAMPLTNSDDSEFQESRPTNPN